MTEALMLDAGVLSDASHPRRSPEFAKWLDRIYDTNRKVIIAEIADYEVRRELLRAKKTTSIARLDQLKKIMVYQPITTSIMLHAAQLWAESRSQGKPTADPKELDADVILAASAKETGAIVVTDNVGHLSLFVPAKSWREIGLTV